MTARPLSRLAKLVALANRPGTDAEGANARARAEQNAARHGLALVETPRGELIAVDSFHADLLRRLGEIAEGTARDEIDRGNA